MLALWLMFTVRLITAALLDCGYIADPTVTIKGEDIKHHAAIPLNVCSSVYLASIGENAFKLSCDESEVIIDVWSGTECDGNTIDGNHNVMTETGEFNCVSQKECDYFIMSQDIHIGETTCNPESLYIRFVTAVITDECITIVEGLESKSRLFTSCDLSGTATMSGYTTTDCTGTKELNIEFTSNAHCVINEGVVLTSVITQAICPTDIPTTNNPTTNNPTTNNPTTNNPTTNNPTTNNPTSHPTSHPTMDPVESESIEWISGSVESADYAHSDKKQNYSSDFMTYVYNNDNENDVEIEFEYNTWLNIWLLCGICALIFIIINCKFGVISF